MLIVMIRSFISATAKCHDAIMIRNTTGTVRYLEIVQPHYGRSLNRSVNYRNTSIRRLVIYLTRIIHLFLPQIPTTTLTQPGLIRMTVMKWAITTEASG